MIKLEAEKLERERKILSKRIEEIGQQMTNQEEVGPGIAPGYAPYQKDPWVNRSSGMRCKTCMYFVRKDRIVPVPVGTPHIGRCRRNAPTMKGYPVVFEHDWCGEHKLNENI